MSISQVGIYNLALQKLGAARVGSTDEDSPNARACEACYEHFRDAELESRAWVFSIKRASLAASGTAPTELIDTYFPSGSAFPLPSDCLRPLIPPRTTIDWVIESIDGSPAIITNDSAPLGIRYIARITDVTKFDTNFVEMLACRMALHMCEEITQSNTKKAAIKDEYKDAKAEARKMNAFQVISYEGAADPWIAARQSGSNSAPWLSRQYE